MTSSRLSDHPYLEIDLSKWRECGCGSEYHTYHSMFVPRENAAEALRLAAEAVIDPTRGKTQAEAIADLEAVLRRLR